MSELVYETDGARCWRSERRSGLYWEVRKVHTFSGEPIWERCDVHVFALVDVAPDHRLAEHWATQPAGTREVWIVASSHWSEPYELVVERRVVQEPGGLFWRWCFYNRQPNVLPGADFQYEDVDGSDLRDHSYAALHVLTHDPDMVVMPGGAR